MSLRAKTLTIIGLTLAGLLVLHVGVGRPIVLQGFDDAEVMQVSELLLPVARAEIMERELGRIRALATDYAIWDDTWEFVADPAARAEYVASNLVVTTFLENELDLILIVDSAGEIVWGKRLLAAEHRLVDAPEEWLDLERLFPPLALHDDPERDVTGLVMAAGVPALVSSHPILRSDRTGEIRGAVVMVRLLDDAERRRLERSSVLPSLRLLLPEALPAADRAALEALRKGGGRDHVAAVDDATVAGYCTLPDLAGGDAILLRIDVRRDISATGLHTFTLLTISLVLSGVLLASSAILLLELVVLRRISRLSEAVEAIGRSSDSAARLPVHGRDEIGQLAASINATLDALAASQGALQYVGRHARCILWTATIERGEDGRWSREFRMQDEGAAQRLLPLDVFHGGSYAHAWQRSLHRDDHDRVLGAPVEAIEGGRAAYEQEFRVRDKEGAERWIQEEVDLERTEPDRWRLVGVCTDITARKAAERQLHEARDAAIEVSRMKSEFLANMTHEIRTPMNGILGMAELLRGTELSVEQREYLDMISSSADSLLRVIDDVLDFSKIEAGRLDLDEDDFSLRRCVADAASLLATRAHQKGLELVCDVDPAAPDGLVGDAVRLRQILFNLIGNAIKFTQRGEVVVQAATEPVGDRRVYVHVAVRDTGIGIPADKQKLIFKAFRQADASTTRRYGGTGLGLAISSQLAQRMHGRMWVESEAGAGSTFHVTALFRLQPQESPRRAVAPDAGLAGRRALVVDDSATSRGVLVRALEGLGLRCEQAGSAAGAGEALAAARGRGAPIEIVVCDAAMPIEDGFAFARTLRAGGDVTPLVMMLESIDRPGDASHCGDLGIVAALRKPVRPAELHGAIRAGLGVAGAEDEPALDSPSEAAWARSLRVLLAEDNPVSQQVAARMIRKRGHDVTVVADGEAALEAAGRGRFDVGLLDLEMPKLGGLEVAAALRRRERERGAGPRLALIALTAHARRGDRERCLAGGMDGYVAKPISAESLFDEIARVVGMTPLPRRGGEGGARATAERVMDRAAALARLDGDRGLLGELIDLFEGDAPRQRDALRAALARRDFAELARIAHALHGALGNFFAGRACRAAGALEHAAAAEDAAEAGRALEGLDRELDRLRPFLAEARQDPPP